MPTNVNNDSPSSTGDSVHLNIGISLPAEQSPSTPGEGGGGGGGGEGSLSENEQMDSRVAVWLFIFCWTGTIGFVVIMYNFAPPLEIFGEGATSKIAGIMVYIWVIPFLTCMIWRLYCWRRKVGALRERQQRVKDFNQTLQSIMPIVTYCSSSNNNISSSSTDDAANGGIVDGCGRSETSCCSNNFDSTICAVCLSEFENGERLRVLQCHHRFHAACIDTWLQIAVMSGGERAPSCPLCNQTLAGLLELSRTQP